MQTTYLRDADIDLITDVEGFLKKEHHPELKGRVGLSFVLRLGLVVLAKEFENDRPRILRRAIALSKAAIAAQND